MKNVKLQNIINSTNVKKIIELPGCDEKITIRIPTDKDYLKASIATEETFKNNKIEMHNIEAYEAEKDAQLLYNIVTDDENKKLFSDIGTFRSILIPGIKDFLLDELVILENENSPDPYEMNSDEVKVFAENLKKKSTKTLSGLTSISLARSVIKSLASQVSSLQELNSSLLEQQQK